MDDLRTTLATFTPDDRKEFGRFLQRQRKKPKGRMDSRLCELLLHKKEYTTAELLDQLYPEEPNAVAYYALRKRLMRHLTDFLLQKQLQEDDTAAAAVRGQLSLAQYLFDAGVPRLAWVTLRKAEKLARTNEQYELLNTVYNLQIEHANNEYADDLLDIIKRRNLNKKAADEEERATIANSLIQQRLQAARTQGRDAAFDTIMQDVLREYDLQEAFARRPSLLYRLMAIARSAVLARRDFVSFEPFILRRYHLMETRHGFTAAHRYYQLGLLYMIAHVLYRNRKFVESSRYLEQLRLTLLSGSRTHYADFYPKYIFLLAANKAFMRRNSESIQLLEELLQGKEVTLSPRDELTARLGLGFHYFTEGKFSKTNQVLIGIGRSDHWCEQKMGVEWVLNKNMGEMLVQLEMGNPDLALNRLRAIERSFRERFGDGGPYRYVLSYLQLVRQVIDDPDVVFKPAFVNFVSQMPHFLPLEREDLQALSFYAWLRARMLKRPYYDVLLEVAGEVAVLENRA
ncbi:hypothetical protein LJY25_13185 [Hymenobacter sp. BT175]|uniref:hypothetical protein n=1 Tax=Hymenobacter translucens TaxID=2886507 RepID=UPI001D0DE062|nr:hypothetical protein [Hymenobacter translucens]MCC2547403.1 hypothetical protein [Hymenobacter translucens]